MSGSVCLCSAALSCAYFVQCRRTDSRTACTCASTRPTSLAVCDCTCDCSVACAAWACAGGKREGSEWDEAKRSVLLRGRERERDAHTRAHLLGSALNPGVELCYVALELLRKRLQLRLCFRLALLARRCDLTIQSLQQNDSWWL